METTASANSNFLFQKKLIFFDVCVKTSYLKRSLVKRVLRLLGEPGQLEVNGSFQKEIPMWKVLASIKCLLGPSWVEQALSKRLGHLCRQPSRACFCLC